MSAVNLQETGRILHLQRLSTEDGPGIRTTVFFKGCPLRCAWCHNPESLRARPQVQWYADRCLDCRTCLETCPNHCLEMTADGLHIDRERCQGCGKCAQACPANALELLGREVTVQALLAELLKDRVYYEKSGGGVTLSGGEPTLQPAFAEALLRALKAEGIHTALDTCGLCAQHTLERLLPFVDLLLFDLKLIDPAAHRRHTGQTNERILANLLHIGGAWSVLPELWVRTPLIPGATMDGDNLRQIGQFLARHLDGRVQRWDLCAFNNLCRDQYTRLGLEWDYAAQPLLTAAELARCEQAARVSGVPPEMVRASGATRLEESDG